MSPEELYEKHKHYAVLTLQKVIPETRRTANALNIDREDLLQYARMGLWKACQTYVGDKQQYKFTSFAIRNIRWYLLKSLQKETRKLLYYKSKNEEGNMVSILSLTSAVDNNNEELIIEDVCYSDNINKFECENPEDKLFSKYRKNKILSMLNPEELKLINLRMNDNLTYQEIANKYGVTRQAIGYKFSKMQTKVNQLLGV